MPLALTLSPLSDAEYADFAEMQVAEYGRQHIRSGDWPEAEAMTRSRETQADLLGDRLRGQGHTFLKALDADHELAGWLWLAPAPAFVEQPRERKRWLSQITVAENRRGEGLGRALLEAIHRKLSDDGVDELWLRVFDWNLAARKLYESAGYERVRQFPTDAHFRKQLRR